MHDYHGEGSIQVRLHNFGETVRETCEKVQHVEVGTAAKFNKMRALGFHQYVISLLCETGT